MKAYVEILGFRSEVARHVAWAIMAVILCLFAGFVFAMSVNAGRDGRLLAAEGVAIEAVVIDKDTTTRHRRRHTSTSYYYLLLSYTPPGMARVEVKESVSRGRYEAMDVGDRMTIRYAPSQPRVHELDPGEKAGSARFQSWMAVGAALGALGSAVWARRLWRKTVPGDVA